MTKQTAGPAFEAPPSEETSFQDAVDSLASLLTDEEEPRGTQEQDEPEDEDEVEETADSADESDQDEEDEADEEEGEEEPVFVIDGEEVTLTQLQEWRRDGLRQADYTRKTQQAAEIRKQAEAIASEAQTLRQEYYQRLEMVKQALEQGAPAKRSAAEWDTLRQQDPVRFAAEWADTQRHQQEMAAVESEQVRVQQEAQEAWLQQMETHLQRERERLYSAIPEWKDESKAKQEKATLRSFAQERYGFTNEELDGVYDHRLMLLLRDAQRFNKLSSEAKPKVEKNRQAAKVLQPGGRTPKTNRSAKSAKSLREKSRKLARTGSIDDAVSLFMDILE